MNKVVNINIKSPEEFFRQFVKITRGYNKLNDTDAEFLVHLLTKRYELALDISNEKHLSKILFDKEAKEEMTSKLGLKNLQLWENKASSFRKKGIILEDNIINPKFVPPVKGKIEDFAITFKIHMIDDKG